MSRRIGIGGQAVVWGQGAGDNLAVPAPLAGRTVVAVSASSITI